MLFHRIILIKPLIFIAMLFGLLILLNGPGSASGLKNKNACIVIAFDGFNYTEYSFSRDMLEAAGIKTKTASSKTGVAEASEQKVPIDLLVDQIKPADYDAVVFIGGLGVADEYYENKAIGSLIKEMAKQGKVVAAICAAQRLVYSTDVIEYKLPGQQAMGKRVRVENNIILGGGPEDAEYFASQVVQAISAK